MIASLVEDTTMKVLILLLPFLYGCPLVSFPSKHIHNHSYQGTDSKSPMERAREITRRHDESVRTHFPPPSPYLE